MNILKEAGKRLVRPTPKFHKKLIRIGLTIGAVGAAIIAAPIALPAAVITAAGYAVTVGTVTAIIAKTAVENPQDIK